MLWVYIIAAVGLVGIMVETWLSYRKEAAHQKKVLARAAKQLGEMIVQFHQALLRERQSVEEGATGGLKYGPSSKRRRGCFRGCWCASATASVR